MTDRKKRTGVWQRVLQLTPSPLSHLATLALMCYVCNSTTLKKKRDWLQCNKRPSTSSKFDLVTCSLVGILSIPSLGLLFRHIWTVVYVWTSSEKPTIIFFCTFAGVLVIRPDSGNPPDVVVKVLNILGKWAYLPNAVWVEFIYWRS